LQGADLQGADLRGAYLTNAIMNWNSHTLIGERLRQAASSNLMRLALAGAVAQNPNYCWEWWLRETDNDLWRETREWALATIRTWVTKDGLPSVLEALFTEEA
jgi:hypothetical protein